ncbi:type IV pilus twitching motility protein PilT [Patescibacteria group bacterium]|nr:type IV pilus twitching motility protein PilT [Patescibacteria group bacterium]
MTIKEIFNHAIKINASDIHMANNLPIFYRVDGKLIPSDKYPKIADKTILSLIKPIINKEQEKVLFEKKHLEFSFETENEIRFRTSIFWEKNKLALVSRIILPKIPTMDEINMPDKVKELINLKNGLILVTGPTGSGKSTTLASIIDTINENKPYHIITLEDPIEFIFKPKKSIVSQRELRKDMLSFNSALKHIVRQDPDVILLSEMRDLETISLAITLAETGHLVLSTLHTSNAPQTIDRIIDIFPSNQQKQIRLQIALSLKAIISQHLLPRINKGRVAAREILINTPGVANLIRENKINQARSLMETGSKDGMSTLEQDLKTLYRNKLIDLKTAMSFANYPDEIIKE